MITYFSRQLWWCSGTTCQQGSLMAMQAAGTGTCTSLHCLIPTRPMTPPTACVPACPQAQEAVRVAFGSDAHPLNLLVATNVGSEGLDFRQCQLVLAFDLPLDVRAAKQAHGVVAAARFASWQPLPCWWAMLCCARYRQPA